MLIALICQNCGKIHNAANNAPEQEQVLIIRNPVTSEPLQFCRNCGSLDLELEVGDIAEIPLQSEKEQR
jgi:hypothetical protein